MGKLIKEEGARIKRGIPYCDHCGQRLDIDENIVPVACIDGIDRYSYYFRCVKCRNSVVQTFERDNEERR